MYAYAEKLPTPKRQRSQEPGAAVGCHGVPLLPTLAEENGTLFAVGSLKAVLTAGLLEARHLLHKHTHHVIIYILSDSSIKSTPKSSRICASKKCPILTLAITEMVTALMIMTSFVISVNELVREAL